METFEEIRTKVLEKVHEVQTTTKRGTITKLAILTYLYLSLQDEETFNNNAKILNRETWQKRIK